MGDFEKIIKVCNISKKFKDIEALSNVSFEVKKNCIFGLLGSNGAGKSTLLHIMIGLLNQNHGEIEIMGERIDKNFSLLKYKLAIVPQKISLYSNLSIYDNLCFFGKTYGLENAEIKKRINELNDILMFGNLKKKIRFLSGGYQRRVSLGVALIGKPEILIMDEALVGIDLETKKIIIELLNKLKETMTIVITTHSVSEVERLCDYICFLHKGKKVLDGKTCEIIEKFTEHHPVRINVRYKDKKTAGDIYPLFKNIPNLHSLLKEDEIEIRFLLKNYTIFSVLDYIKKNNSHIINLEIHKPGIEDIVLGLIKE